MGPLIGALLLVNYRLSCLVAAGVFACMWLAYLAMFPNIATLHKSEPILEGWGKILGNRVFLLFALANNTYLVAYNQLYLALPVEFKRLLGNDRMLGILMAISAFMVITGHRSGSRHGRVGACVEGAPLRWVFPSWRQALPFLLPRAWCHPCHSHGPSHHRSP